MLSDAPHLHVRFLGRFALTDASNEPVVLRSRRARGLFAYLHFQQPHSEGRGKLCGLFWGDRSEPQARASLRQCLSELRAGLPPEFRDCIAVERDAVRLDVSRLSTDTSALRAAIQDGRQQDLRTLLERAGASQLLEDVELPGAFSEWLAAVRAQFDRELALGVRRLVERGEAQAEWPAVRDLAEAYLMRDPVDEIVATALIRAETAMGDRTSARRRLQALRSALGKAFGVEPNVDALAALTGAVEGHRAARAADPAPGPRPPPASPVPNLADAHLPLVVVADFDSSLLEDSGRPLGGVMKGEVVSGLSGFREFRVSSAPGALSQFDAEAWARRGASYGLGGTLWRSAGGVRLTAQVIRASDQQVIWSQRMELSYPQLTEAVDLIITKIIGAVSPVIDADLELVRSGLGDQYARYVAARGAAAAPADFEAAKRAAADLEALIAETPGFILPYLPLARLYNNDFAYTRALSSGPAERARALALAKAALSGARSHIHAYTVVGWCHLREGQWSAARTHFEQALALNPFHAERVMEIGYGFFMLGDLDRAKELLNRCILLNPIGNDITYLDLALFEMLNGNYDVSSHYLGLVAKPVARSLLYRTINAKLRQQPHHELGESFLKAARLLWDPTRPFTSELVMQWICEDHPFAPATLQKQFTSVVHEALFSTSHP